MSIDAYKAQQELASKREKFSELAKLRDAEFKASADAVKARAKAERDALTELEKAKRAHWTPRHATRKRYGVDVSWCSKG